MIKNPVKTVSPESSRKMESVRQTKITTVQIVGKTANLARQFEIAVRNVAIFTRENARVLITETAVPAARSKNTTAA